MVPRTIIRTMTVGGGLAAKPEHKYAVNMCNEFPDPGFLFDLHCIRGSICNRFQVLKEVSVERFFPTSAEIERSRKFDLLLWRHFQT